MNDVVQDQSQHWKELEDDPNAEIVLRRRCEQIERAGNHSLVRDRISFIQDLCSGKKVLDVGVVEHFESAYKGKNWLHRYIVDVAESCVGVDILDSEIEKLNHEGFNVKKHDLTESSLQEKYDVIVCGELIEHVDNVGALLRNIAASLADGGMVILTTPNPWYINATIKNTFGKAPFTDNVDHVAWYDPSTMVELAQRSGLYLDKYYGIRVNTNTIRSKLFFFMIRMFRPVIRINPVVLSKSNIYILKK